MIKNIKKKTNNQQLTIQTHIMLSYVKIKVEWFRLDDVFRGIKYKRHGYDYNDMYTIVCLRFFFFKMNYRIYEDEYLTKTNNNNN